MELLQRKREALRVQIRRKEVESMKRKKRDQLTFTDQQDTFLALIREKLALSPSSLFPELSAYFWGCSAVEKRAFANSVWNYLISESFRRCNYSCEGLPHLLIDIFPFLTYHEQRRLPPLKILPVLFRQLSSSPASAFHRHPEIFELAFFMSSQASRQSQSHIKFRQQEIEKIILTAEQQLSPCSLQLLALTLTNLEGEVVRRQWRRRLMEVGRRAVGMLGQGPQLHRICLRLLAAIGKCVPYEEKDKQVVLCILQHYEQIGFQLVLRFLSFQAMQDYLTLQDAANFLSACSNQLGDFEDERQKWHEVDIYLGIIYKLTYFQDNDFLSKAYSLYFEDKLHHFIHPLTAQNLISLSNLFFKDQNERFKEELTRCGMLLLKSRRGDETQEQVVMLSLNLLINDCSDSELLEVLGLEMFEKVIEQYQQMNNNPPESV